ncbi:MAG: F0F1 ATP synthase subunit B [Elusimicrobiota bacterium]|jgi:F-type H+-transporting ATPase subunit b
MDKLLSPDTGMMFWTITTFLILVVLLKRYAWGPLLKAIAEREAGLKADVAAARSARDQAQSIRDELAAQAAGAESRRQELLSQAAKEGEAIMSRLRETAEKDARQMRDKAWSELAREKERLLRELRGEVAGISFLAAEKLLRRNVDSAVEKRVLEDFLQELDKGGDK